MKKIVTLIMILVSIVGIIGICYKSNLIYTKQAVITGQDEITDYDGNIWGYTELPYSTGSNVSVTFSDNGTENIEDDIIISISK